ncbi:hypothetical protein FI667_g2252, partial [Globisporangium splendens]
MAKRRRADEDERLQEQEREQEHSLSPSKRRHGEADLPHQVTHSDSSAQAITTRIASGAEENAAARYNGDETASETPQVDMELSGVFGEQSHAETNADSEGIHGSATGRETGANSTADVVVPLIDAHDHMGVDAGGFADARNDPSMNEDTTAVVGGSSSPMVIAPMFTPVHRSWEEFEQRLKEYAQATYQMYVIRTTTSVKRRNLRITENASATSVAPVALGSAVNIGGEVEREASASRESPADVPQALFSDSDQVLIPESYQWYSKTLMCTHGWKDRNRGSGKRSLSIVRSTRCPAKMCVTLQHRGKGDDGWQVVLTRHVRTHNHQLSRELYLYYMENRRIYDPDLLVVSTSQPTISSVIDPGRPHHQLNRAKLSHLLASHEILRSSPQNTSSESTVSLGAQNGSEDVNPVFQTASRAPKVLVKVHDSWETFHKYVVKYSAATQQSFRARSTVSAAAKNAKTKSFALKAGRSLDNVADQLIPEEERWYSKMMICNHGWKRKSRSKAPKSDTEGGGNFPNACPAMLLARLQRDGNNNWRVVINRQVLEHNHSLTHEKAVPIPSASTADTRRMASNAVAAEQEPNVHAELHLFGNESAAHHPEGTDSVEYGDEEEDEQRPNRAEIVVRAPKLEAIHASWEAFHARLQEYSDATFQLYRTRTTSSVQGRNQKIPDIKRALTAHLNSTSNPEGSKSNDTRLIPEEWKWYSKTLTCTHGWKERRRGTGKRTIQVFRSTSCPVKICATVQFVEDAEANADPSSNSGSWRVVVTKHVVDHNHNLSKELHQHYCENRRIYDPDLLTIDESNEAAVVKQSRQHHTFLMNTEAPPFFPQAVAGFTQPKTMHAVSDGREPSADHGQLAGNGLHPLTLMADVSSHPEQMSASPPSSVANSARKNADGVSAQAGLVQGFSTAPLISYTGAFPSGAGSHALFPAAGSQQASPYLLHAHQYFAADQIGNSSIAQAAHSHLSAMGLSHGSSDGNDMSNIANVATNALLGSGRIHGSGPHSGNSGQCTCFRGTSPNMYYPLTSCPLHARANEPSLSGKSRKSERVSRGDEPEDENEEEPDEEPNGSVVWSPTSPVEITTVSTDLGTSIWRAPRIKRLHDSWDAFQEHLDLYSVATFQLYRVRTTSSVSSRNSRIAQQTAAREMPIPVASFESGPQSPAAPRFVPDSYQWYSKTFVCTHGWKERRRGKGQRVSHSLRSTECSAKLCVTLQKSPHEMNSNKWRVVVTRQTTDHNHEISVQAYQQYSENRRIKDSSLLDQAEELWKKGLTRRKIYEFLKEQCPNAILMKDVHNLVQRWQAQQQPSSNSNGSADSSSRSPTAAATDCTQESRKHVKEFRDPTKPHGNPCRVHVLAHIDCGIGALLTPCTLRLIAVGAFLAIGVLLPAGTPLQVGITLDIVSESPFGVNIAVPLDDKLKTRLSEVNAPLFRRREKPGEAQTPLHPKRPSMYGELDPAVVYGVVGESSDRVISKSFLEKFGLERHPRSLVRLYACDAENEARLDKFAAALEKGGIDFGEQDHHLAIHRYDCGMEHEEYLTDEVVDPSELVRGKDGK